MTKYNTIKNIKNFAFGVSLSILFTCTAFAQFPNLKFEQIGSENGLPQSTIHGIVKDKYGFMWFGTWGGLCRYDGYSFKVYKFDPENDKSINSSRIHNVIKDSLDNIWILTFQGEELCRYNYERDDFDRIPAANVSPSFLDKLIRWKHNESVNFSYKQFSWRLDKASKSLVQADDITNKKTYYETNPANQWSLSNSFAVDIYKDNHNIFWVGTYSNGINKANLNAKPFDYYFHDPVNTNSIIDNNVRAICEDKDGNLWIGTWDKGITIIQSDNKYRHIFLDDKDKENFTHDQIKKIFCDSKGIIWVGTKGGLYNYNPKTGLIRKFDETFQKFASVYSIIEDDEQNIWIASYWKGVFKYDREKDAFKLLVQMNTLQDKNPKVIIQDKIKQIWVGTEGNGLFLFKPTNDTVALVKHFNYKVNNVDNVIRDNRINYLYEGKDGLMWIGTGHGLNFYNPTLGKFIDLPEKTGLTNITISAITGDKKGYLWISHKSGISKLNSKTYDVQNYTQQDGLQSNEFTDGAVFNNPYTNRLYFGGNNGLNAFNPDSILLDMTLPNTVLTELEILNHKVQVNGEINGRKVLTKPLYLTDKIELTYDDKSVAFEFAGLHYANPEGNKYAYKLEGFDKDWVYTDASRRRATYSNLKPGDYIFKVISSNSDGIWNKEPAILNIVVKPPFWASTWAYILYLALFLALLYIYHRYSLRYSRLKAKLSFELLIKEKENELHQSKLQFFTNISHEIKTPLTLILAPVEKLLHLFSNHQVIVSELLTMKTNGDRLLKLINQLLDFRRLETGNLELDLKRNNIIAFLISTLKSFKSLAEANKIKLEFSSSVEACFFQYDEDKLEKVISNLVSNAIKFTPAQGWIRLGFSLEAGAAGNVAVIEVINTGKAIPVTEYERIFKPFQQIYGNIKEGTGLGLAYSKGLIEQHGGTIEVSSTKPTNDISETSFIIRLPLDSIENFEQGEALEVISVEAQDIIDQEAPLAENFAKLQEERVLVNGRVPVVLIVEDNLNLRKYLCQFFGNQYQVLEAENGFEGFTIASQSQPDLIISDVEMPEMNGFELCKKVKTEIKTAHIPVILLTARTPIEDEIEGLETGADDYITKPFNLALLTARVKNLLILRNKLKENYRREIALKPSEEIPMSADEIMLKKTMEYVEEHLSDPELNIDGICAAIGVSRANLYRKIKALTGLGMAEVIKEIRLKRAKQLLKDGNFNINEVSDLAGFSDTHYFRKCFKAEFGITPSEYSKQQEELRQVS